MASKNRERGQFLAPPTASESDDANASLEDRSSARHHSRKRVKRRQANIYDAVAGRVSNAFGLDDASRLDAPQRGVPSLRDPPLAPEEVLFRRKGAPVRYAEKDIYHAHENLPEAGEGVLPDSDLLKAIHVYASHYYAAAKPVEMNKEESLDEQSMDETALLAFGILLEEAGREALGRRGDLVLTEGVPVGDHGEAEPNHLDDCLGPPVAW